MLVLSPPGQALKFDLGLVPGVFVGAFISALLWRELKLEGFQGGQSMRRYIAGAVLMGFGGMLAGGCAVGAGVSGAAVFTMTSWVTLCTMWASAMLTDALLDGRTRPGHRRCPPTGRPGAERQLRAALKAGAGFGSLLTLLGGSKAGVPARWRPGRGRGVVHGLVREHTDRLRGVADVSSALRTPSPARPHNPGQAGQGFVAGQKGIRFAGCGPRSRGRHCERGGFAARGPRALTQGRGCGVGQGLAREARRRRFPTVLARRL